MFGFADSRGQRWYLLYFVLASLDIIAIAGSMAMNHIQLAQYESVVASNSSAFRLLEELSTLAQFAQKENAPGNDVFDSLDAPREKQRQFEAAGAFDAQLQKIESLYLRSAVENAQLTDEYRLSLRQIQESSDRMRETAALIFSHFANGNRDAAGAYMAEMDRRFARLVSGIEDLRTAISVRQQESLLEHTGNLENKQRLELALGVLITLCVFGALFYGRKMAGFVRGSFRDAEVNKRILDTINEVAIVTFTDKFGVITEVNDNFCRISGFERNELVGQTHRVVNSGVHDRTFFQDMWSAIASGKSWTADIENRKKTGEHYFVRTVISPILGQDGRPDRYLAIRFDISDQKKAEQSLNAERVKSLRNAKFASLGEMCAGVAHEINNPLGIISGTVELLPKFIDNKDKLSSRVATIQDACERIAKIVKSLRKFSRSDEKAERAICSISDVVGDAIVLTNAKAKRHNTLVTFKNTSVQSIWCDEIEIEQVLVNLINNGIDAVKNQIERWLLISSFDDGAAVVLRVIDSGPGLSQESQSRLFQPFFTTKPVGHGTGLGLSIARGILEDHKATIELLPDEPNTCFEIRFPVAEVQKSAV